MSNPKKEIDSIYEWADELHEDHYWSDYPLEDDDFIDGIPWFWDDEDEDEFEDEEPE